MGVSSGFDSSQERCGLHLSPCVCDRRLGGSGTTCAGAGCCAGCPRLSLHRSAPLRCPAGASARRAAARRPRDGLASLEGGGLERQRR
jgi:hypothetical protein